MHLTYLIHLLGVVYFILGSPAILRCVWPQSSMQAQKGTDISTCQPCDEGCTLILTRRRIIGVIACRNSDLAWSQIQTGKRRQQTHHDVVRAFCRHLRPQDGPAPVKCKIQEPDCVHGKVWEISLIYLRVVSKRRADTWQSDFLWKSYLQHE